MPVSEECPRQGIDEAGTLESELMRARRIGLITDPGVKITGRGGWVKKMVPVFRTSLEDTELRMMAVWKR